MIPRAYITAWRSHVPWADDAQVEQDLVLTRAVIELFSSPALAGSVALRGGTALHKLTIRPAARYSEDIDLVQSAPGPIGGVIDGIRALIDPWLGTPRRERAGGSVTLTYRFESEIEPVRPLRLKVEINTREHFTLLGHARVRLRADNPWFGGEAEVVTFHPDELMATKLRALYQRRKGRDLFDLWLCAERGLIDPVRVVAGFGQYMEHGGHTVSRAEFERNLFDKGNDASFLADMTPLLASGIGYDAEAALRRVGGLFVARLAGDPWRGPSYPPKRRRK